MAEQYQESLIKLLTTARFEDNLAKGLHESCKAIESLYDGNRAALCILAEDCKEEKYKQLVTALCKQNSIPLVKVENRVSLGEWVGLCKFDSTNTARKIRGCSCMVIKRFNERDQADVDLVKQHIA